MLDSNIFGAKTVAGGFVRFLNTPHATFGYLMKGSRSYWEIILKWYRKGINNSNNGNDPVLKQQKYTSEWTQIVN